MESDPAEKSAEKTIVTEENDMAYLTEKMGNSEEGMVLEIPEWSNLVELLIS
jgi:hypothetical protein